MERDGMTGRVDRKRLARLLERESAAFSARIPQSRELRAAARQLMPDGVPMAWMAGLYHHAPLFAASGAGSRFEDVDGNSYVDFNLSDLSNTIGFGPNAVSRRVAAQAERGIQFLLPTEDAIAVSEELRRRTGMPYWQYTVSASSANTEVIRIARAFTGRAKIVIFEGKYHGHIDVTMAKGGKPDENIPAEPEAMGISSRATFDTVNVPFNDAAALARVLARGDVALVLTEPALTNCGLILADPGFIAEICRLTREAGALFALDETHTTQFAFGGIKRAERLPADLLVLGKGLGTGVPLGAYGMDERLGAFLERHRDYGEGETRGLAIGGTTFAGAMTMAGVRAALEEILTEDGYGRIAALGSRLAGGIGSLVAGHALPWRAFHYGPRSGFCQTPDLPRNLDEVLPSLDQQFSDARRVFMANRGIWEAIVTAGPQVSFAHSVADVERYLDVAGEFMSEVVSR